MTGARSCEQDHTPGGRGTYRVAVGYQRHPVDAKRAPSPIAGEVARQRRPWHFLQITANLENSEKI